MASLYGPLYTHNYKRGTAVKDCWFLLLRMKYCPSSVISHSSLSPQWYASLQSYSERSGSAHRGTASTSFGGPSTRFSRTLVRPIGGVGHVVVVPTVSGSGSDSRLTSACARTTIGVSVGFHLVGRVRDACPPGLDAGCCGWNGAGGGACGCC